jgi:hypothetical protein
VQFLFFDSIGQGRKLAIWVQFVSSGPILLQKSSVGRAMAPSCVLAELPSTCFAASSVWSGGTDGVADTRVTTVSA